MAAIFVLLMSFDTIYTYVVAYVVFTVAAITDYFDGKIARDRNLVTNFGKLFDPIADKVLMLSAFITLVTIRELMIPGWAIVTILAREFLVTGARTLAAAEGVIIPANKWGKTKTVLQMVYVFTVLVFAVFLRALMDLPAFAAMLPGDINIYELIMGRISLVAIIAVALYTVYSGVQFARINWKILGLDKQL
jgi:CDP-diacylglycerol--glycerol-3-phosphate 3-phosphatidyltransferase